MSFIAIDIEADAEQLKADAVQQIQQRWPDWEPEPGNLESVILDGMSRMAAELAAVAVDVPPEIFKNFGQKIVNVQPLAEESALVNSTWTVIDDAGYTVRAGTEVIIPAAGDELVAFRVDEDVVIPQGSTSTAAGEVALIAVVPGANANGLTANPELIDAIDWVNTISMIGSTSGGQDAEDENAYLNRLTLTLTTLSLTPIVPRDFEVLALLVASVHRAMAIDLYNPIDETTNNEKMITVAVVDAAGEPLGDPIKDEVKAVLQARRETNFVVHVIDPTYNDINIESNVIVYPGFDPDLVAAEVAAQLAIALDPSRWGRPLVEDSETLWYNTKTVYYLEIAQIVNNVQGVDRIDTLTIAKEGNPLGTDDFALAGVVPLTRPNTITITGESA